VLGVALLLTGAVATIAKPGNDHQFQSGFLTLIGVICIGVGGSALASALVARMVSRQVFGIDFGDAVEALRGASALVRSNQKLEILLERVGDGVRVTAEHRFDLTSARLFRQHLQFRLYTDIGRWCPDGGGFTQIVEPGGGVLSGDALSSHVRTTEGKAEFEKEYTFHPRRPESFVVETYGLFRSRDRLIWTVEHISRDFSVVIRDRRHAHGDVQVKVNHHRAPEIAKAMAAPRDAGDGRIMEFAYLGEVLPYQGFELEWSDDE
jgi:hypothetical protein